MAYHLPYSVPGSQEERKALHYFSVSAAADIGGYFSADFWTRSILQRCQHDVPVRYAVAALSRLHHEYITSSVQEPFTAGCEAVTGYIKAMKALRRYLNRQTTSDLRVVMMCCAAFFCFELIRGEQGAALRHLHSGAGVLHQWQQRYSVLEVTERSGLVDVFARMDLQASAFDDGVALVSRRPPIENGHVESDRLSDPSAMSRPGPHAAKYSLLLRRCFNFLVENARWRRVGVAGIPAEALGTRRGLLNELQEWNQHLEVLDTEQEASPHLRSTIARSRFHSAMISSLVAHCLPSSASTVPTLDDRANELLHLANESIGVSDSRDKAADRRPKRHFCLHLGVIAPLFLLALKTSRSDVLASCLGLLRACKGRREGLYDADVVVEVIEGVIRRYEVLHAGSSLLDQMGEHATNVWQDAMGSVAAVKEEDVRRARALSRLLAIVG